jgi:hypothetical protein
MAKENRDKGEILNLDLYAEEPAIIKYKNKEYALKEISVEKYLTLQRIYQKMQDTNEINTQIEAIVEIIKEVVPGLEDEIKEMNFKQVIALIDLISKKVSAGVQFKGEQQGNLQTDK